MEYFGSFTLKPVFIKSTSYTFGNRKSSRSKFEWGSVSFDPLTRYRLPTKSKISSTPYKYDHTHWKTRDPVRSPIDKPVKGSLSKG
ncbi:hypothetical protein B0T26DRAFT_722853 [Lasiosphaeria miniovina]|uniref:Uncharacterized protein n=1 Tax=Lasiosphaeria miniovina TaxID=1954250 RepID=A0AA40DN21_9PEZI|nr:uncharacterized protein B0T26DRAFT_722853 [Lasiosphaeria miniovina]KAK0709759.1 hypothetical protein B0T26DRAFT_722853 [Lasiosphaeria miniovina]